VPLPAISLTGPVPFMADAAGFEAATVGPVHRAELGRCRPAAWNVLEGRPGGRGSFATNRPIHVFTRRGSVPPPARYEPHPGSAERSHDPPELCRACPSQILGQGNSPRALEVVPVQHRGPVRARGAPLGLVGGGDTPGGCGGFDLGGLGA
jgi:hypothetical protein